MAIYANISVDQGSDFYSIIEVEDADGLILDLSNYSVNGQVRKTYNSSTAINFTAAVSDGPRGQISISLTATQTNAMKPGRYVYDVEIISVGGTVTRVVEGQLEVTPSVTRV